MTMQKASRIPKNLFPYRLMMFLQFNSRPHLGAEPKADPLTAVLSNDIFVTLYYLTYGENDMYMQDLLINVQNLYSEDSRESPAGKPAACRLQEGYAW